MTIKYHPSDDGKVVDGKTVVFLPVPRADEAWVDELDATHVKADGAAGGDDPSAKKPAAKTAKSGLATPAAPSGVKVKGKVPVPDKIAAGKAQAAALTAAAKDGQPFCEECEKARQKLAALAAGR